MLDFSFLSDQDCPMKITLTDAQKEALELMHDTTRDGRVRDRIKAVLLASEATVLNTIFMAYS